MTFISPYAKGGSREAAPAENKSVSLESAHYNLAPSPKQEAPKAFYRCARKGSQGQTLWIQGEELSPVLTPGEMHDRARYATAVAFQDAHAGRSLRWAAASLFLDGRTVIDGKTLRTPSEHRAILAALDEIKKPNQQTVAELARSIADVWEGR